MGAILDKANTVLADGPSANPTKPDKAQFRQLFGLVESVLASVASGITVGNAVVYQTRSSLFADLAHTAGKLGIVYGDSTDAYNGVYIKSGGSGSGSWTLTDLSLPSSFAGDLAEALELKDKVDGIESGADKTDKDNVGLAIVSADAKSTELVNNDRFAILDSEESYALKDYTWLALKAAIKSYLTLDEISEGSTGKRFTATQKSTLESLVTDKADLASPEFTGTPKAPTATTSYADATQIVNIAALLALSRGMATVNVSGHTDGVFTFTDAQARNPVVGLTGTLSQDIVVEIPTENPGLSRIIRNATSGGKTVTVRHVGQASGGAIVPSGTVVPTVSNGTDILGAGVTNSSPHFVGTPTAPSAGFDFTDLLQIVNVAALLNFARSYRSLSVATHVDGVFTMSSSEKYYYAVAFTGSLSQDVTVEIPTGGAYTYLFRNATGGGRTIYVRHVGQSNSVEIPWGSVRFVVSNGTTLYLVDDDVISTVGQLDVRTGKAETAISKIRPRYVGEYSNAYEYSQWDVVRFDDAYYFADSLDIVETNYIRNPRFENNRNGWQGSGVSYVSYGNGSVRVALTAEKSANTAIYTQTNDHNAPANPGETWSCSIDVENHSESSFDVKAGLFFAGYATIYKDPVTVPAGQKVTVKAEAITAGGSANGVRIALASGSSAIPSGTELTISNPILVKAATVPEYFDGTTTDEENVQYSWSGDVNDSYSVKVTAVESDTLPPPVSSDKWVPLIGDVATESTGASFTEYEPTVTEKPAAEIVSFMTRDRTVGFNFGSSNLYETYDDGENWTLLNTFSGAQTNFIRELANGELLVSIQKTDASELWLSDGYRKGGTVNWSKVLESHSKHIKFTDGWSFYEDGNLVLVIDYGGKAGMNYNGEYVDSGDNARYAYMSLDYGKTWETIFDLNEWCLSEGYYTLDESDEPQAWGVHCHGIAYDKWWDRIWITFGDNITVSEINSIGGTVYSDDFGATWKWANKGKDSQSSSPTNSPHQFVGIKPMPKCILFGTDTFPNGIHRIERSQGKTIDGEYTINVAYDHNEATSRTHLCHRIQQFEHLPNTPVFFAFGAEGVEAKSFAVATYDGFYFNKVWEAEEESAAGYGVRSIVGPTRRGNLIIRTTEWEDGVAVNYEVKGKAPIY